MKGLGVPGAVLPGVPAGLCSFEGGCESPLGPMEKVGGCFGWLDMAPVTCGGGAADVPLCGDSDLCGVMISEGRAYPLAAEPRASRDLVPAGVSGGECTAGNAGEARGEASTEPEPACIDLRGVFEPDPTYTDCQSSTRHTR